MEAPEDSLIAPVIVIYYNPLIPLYSGSFLLMPLPVSSAVCGDRMNHSVSAAVVEVSAIGVAHRMDSVYFVPQLHISKSCGRAKTSEFLSAPQEIPR